MSAKEEAAQQVRDAAALLESMADDIAGDIDERLALAAHRDHGRGRERRRGAHPVGEEGLPGKEAGAVSWGGNGNAERKLRARLRAEGRPCHICGMPIDYSLPPGDPWSFEADHVNPRARGANSPRTTTATWTRRTAFATSARVRA